MRPVPRLFAFTFGLIALLALDSLAQQKPEPQRPKLPAGFVAEYDVPYVPDGDAAQVLDIYYPEDKTAEPRPLLVWIHGGGWSGGSKAGMPYLSRLADGYVVASIEYRFSQKAVFPAQIQDCQAAIRFLRANADKYRIDPAKVGVGGASAGGHLAALVGTSGGDAKDTPKFPKIGGNDTQSDRVQAVCDIYGPTNFWKVIAQAEADKDVAYMYKWNQGDPYSRLIGGKLGGVDGSGDRAKCDAVSPVHYVSKESPPFLIMHGDRDPQVPYAQSEELAELLKKAGVEVTLQRLPGAGHGGPQFSLPAINELTKKFFDKHLKGVEAKIEALPPEAVMAKPQAEPAKAKAEAVK